MRGAVVARTLASSSHKDPLSAYQHSSWASERMCRECVDGTEIYWHSGNSGGKTYSGIALDIALAQNRHNLGGISLPVLSRPASGALIVPSYKIAMGSTIIAMRELLGSWPKHEIKLGDYVTSVYIKPIGWRSDDHESWSKITVFPTDGEVPEGLRLDFAHADEPPDQRLWEAIRFRGKRGRLFLRYITATPLEKRYWWWLMQEAEFKDCLLQKKNGRFRMQSSMRDNKMLTPMDISRAEEFATGKLDEQARLMGEHIDATGKCPWPYELLHKWLGRCWEPGHQRLVVTAQKETPGGRVMTEVAVNIDIWAPYDPDDVYYEPIDPSSGIPGRDPAAIHIWSRRRRALVAAFSGHLEPYGLGSLAAQMGRMYGQALIDVERNGGWAQPVFAALHDAKYPSLSRERYEERPGFWDMRLGWTTNEENRALMLSSIHQALLRDDVGIWSDRLVHQLLECVVDEKGKILAGPGSQDEEVILAGRALYLIMSRAVASRAPEERPQHRLDRIRGFITGLNGPPPRRPRTLLGGPKW